MLRRTITIEDSLNEDANRLRSIFIGRNIELDYTSAINILAKLGAKRMMSGQMTPEEWGIAFQYMKNQQLQNEGFLDQAQDWFIRNIPRVLQEIAKTNQQTKQQ